MWLDELDLTHCNLLPPVATKTLDTLEAQLDVKFPTDYREFLMHAGGGMLHGQRFLLFTVEPLLHPSETLAAINRPPNGERPLVLVGRDAENAFGFLRADLPAPSCPVYFLSHEFFELHYASNSFKEFIKTITQLSPGEAFTLPDAPT